METRRGSGIGDKPQGEEECVCVGGLCCSPSGVVTAAEAHPAIPPMTRSSTVFACGTANESAGTDISEVRGRTRVKRNP